MTRQSNHGRFLAGRSGLILRAVLAACLVAALDLSLGTVGASAQQGAPAWTLSIVPVPGNFTPGTPARLKILAVNAGGASPSGSPFSVDLTLPLGVEALSAAARLTGGTAKPEPTCTVVTTQVAHCESSAEVNPGLGLLMSVDVSVSSALPEGPLQLEALASGGGSGASERTFGVSVQAAPRQFGFTDGLSAPLLDADGAPSFLAGSHPNQQSVDFGFPVFKTVGESGGSVFASSGPPRDIAVDLPRGLIVNPTATAMRCTEAQLEAQACPDASQLGIFDLSTLVLGDVGLGESRIYNMVPPPGYPAELAFNGANQGLLIHVLGSVRSESDFGIEALIRDVPGLGSNPVFNDYTQLWGDPSAPVHDQVRGGCLSSELPLPPCTVSRDDIPLISMPTDCSGEPLRTAVSANSWSDPQDVQVAEYESADLQGNPVSVAGCNQLEFEPRISVAPTTNLADSPSGLQVALHQPQELPREEPLAGRVTGELRDARVTLPEGLVANPSQADGRGVCTLAEIGHLADVQGIHFSKSPDSCPDAAKLGTVEVTTPLLAQYTEQGTKLATDPETGAPLPEPLHGSVYLAKPFENPFHSLLAIYLSINDPRSGTIAKLAGEVRADSQTGQLTTVFEENPELPLEDVRLSLFGGARGPLISPPTCGIHTTTTDLTPWSAPETADAHPTSSFQTTATPAPGACPSSAEQAPNAPTFGAGTVSPEAGAYSPFVLKLSREDGTQRLTGFDTTLPPGLSGKLAGVGECSEAQIARAASRNNPEEGVLEREDPSCPASSRLGTVNVGAGAGPTPFYAQGTAYLAGRYKGGPVSMVVITPAIAGPFDLGTVVVRAALYLNPDTAQIHAVSDPFPAILHGIPLDLRSVAVNLSRTGFTLNPTSCDPMAIVGQTTSVFDQSAPLSQRFQVGGCAGLPFKPKLSLRLKGKTKRTSHPTLIANLTAKPGEANIARAQVKLPKAVFLDQGNIKTVCTRVQFAAKSCPVGSIYGKVSATTPLLDYPLTGNVYLRSSSHLLPDLIADLNGPASQPIEIALAGKTDSVKGVLRNTFEAVPDAPVSTFHLELFGGGRGLIELTSGLCKDPKATVKLDGQNGKALDTRQAVKTSCKRGKKQGGKHKR